MPESKQVRLCVGCGQHDTAPRHTGTDKGAWHLDCHVLLADCSKCKAQLAAADSAQGDALQAHLISIRQES